MLAAVCGGQVEETDLELELDTIEGVEVTEAWHLTTELKAIIGAGRFNKHATQTATLEGRPLINSCKSY